MTTRCGTGACSTATTGADGCTPTDATAGSSGAALLIVHFVGQGFALWWQHGIAQTLSADASGASTKPATKSARIRMRRVITTDINLERAGIPAYDKRHTKCGARQRGLKSAPHMPKCGAGFIPPAQSNASSAAATSSFDGRSR